MIAIRRFALRRGILSCCAGVLTGIFGATILFKDLILAGRPDVLWADGFDSRLLYWIVNWGYHILFEQMQPLSFWNANSFFPNSLTLAYSDSLFGMQFLFAPLRMLGIPPLVSLYMTLAGMCIIGAMLTQHALYRMGYFSLSERILITFCAHFSLSVISFFVHYQLFGFQLAPPFFLFLYLYLRDLKQKDLFTLVSLFAVGISIAMYLAPMLFVFCILLGIPLALKQISRLGIRELLKKIGIRGFGIVAICMLVGYFVQIKPYLEVAHAFPKQSFEETTLYSADLVSIFTGFSKFSFWYGPAEYPVYGAWEYAFFPGFVLLTLGALYWVGILGIKVKGRFISPGQNSRYDRFQQVQQVEGNPIPGVFITYMVILFVSAIILSWGPYYKLDHSIRLPFYFLSKFIFGLRDIRAPGRFGMFISLPLAVFAIAFFRLSVFRRSVRHWVVLLVTILIAAESFPNFPVFPFSIDSEGVYKRVSQEIEPGTPLLELPVFGKDHGETIKIAMEQLDGSTIHWGSMVVGYGSKTTSDYVALLDLDSMIQKELANPAAVIQFGKRYGISYYLIHLNRYDSAVAQKWKELACELEGRVLFETKDTIFLWLRNQQDESTIGFVPYYCTLKYETSTQYRSQVGIYNLGVARVR